MRTGRLARQATLRELACADSLEELQHLLAPAARLGTPIGASPYGQPPFFP